MPLDKVDSTVFSHVGYDPDTKRLELRFKASGKSFFYENFPASLYRRFRASKSLGKFYNKHIRDQRYSE